MAAFGGLVRPGLRVVGAFLIKAAASVTATRDCPLRGSANGWRGSFAHCGIFESGRSAAILLTSLVEIRQ